MNKANEPQAITVLFSPRIQANGDIVLVRVRQGDVEIQMTKEQALSLVQQINARHLAVP